jgi:hypothetical protein
VELVSLGCYAIHGLTHKQRHQIPNPRFNGLKARSILQSLSDGGHWWLKVGLSAMLQAEGGIWVVLYHDEHRIDAALADKCSH